MLDPLYPLQSRIAVLEEALDRSTKLNVLLTHRLLETMDERDDYRTRPNIVEVWERCAP